MFPESTAMKTNAVKPFELEKLPKEIFKDRDQFENWVWVTEAGLAGRVPELLELMKQSSFSTHGRICTSKDRITGYPKINGFLEMNITKGGQDRQWAILVKAQNAAGS